MAKRRINYANCSMLFLILALILSFVSGCGAPSGFIHIAENHYLNANTTRVVDQGTINGKPYWMATVEYIELNPKNDTVLNKETVWVTNYNPYTNTIDGMYYYNENYTNVFGWDHTSKGFALYDAFGELYDDYVSKQLKVGK